MDQKHSCGTCDYWRVQAGMTRENASVIAAANGNGSDTRPERNGHCLLRLTMVNMPVPSRLNPQAAELMKIPVHDIRAETEVCDRHPRIVETTLKGAIRFAIHSWKTYLDYKPGVHPDEAAGGFSRMPANLFEVLSFAVGVNEAPGAPLSAESANPPMPEFNSKGDVQS